MSIKEILSSCSVFEGLDKAHLESIEAISEVIDVKINERIIAKGESANSLYVIGSGAIRLCMPILILMSEQEVVLDVKQSGDLIGWSALIPPHELTMSAYAAEDSQLIRIPGDKLQELLDRDEHIGFMVIISRISSLIGNRLIQLEHMLAKEIELNAPSI